jgi:adenosylmethionine-8-amino-7-oxononanoate aminotransferase
VAKAEGSYLYTREGLRLLDAASGAVVVNVGQGREELARVAAEQVAELSYVVPYWISPARERLVERLATWTPGRLNRFFFTSGGSEAIETAIKFAILFHKLKGNPEKKTIISRRLSYHGNTLAALSAGGHTERRADYEHVLFDWPKIGPSYCYRCPWERTYPVCALECARQLEAEIQRVGAESVAAFIAEPIVGSTAGAVVPVPEYWPAIAEICRHYDVLLVADEVMTGFGRTGKRFGVDHWGVVPDILVGGKGLTGGYVPMGMVAVDERLVDTCEQEGADFTPFTYSANPLACAMADRVLNIMERERLVERAAAVGALLGDRLGAAVGDHPLVGDLRGTGLLWGIELVRDRTTREPFAASTNLAHQVVVASVMRGVFFYPITGMAGPQVGDTIIVAPPLIVREDEIELIASTLRTGLDDVYANLDLAHRGSVEEEALRRAAG